MAESSQRGRDAIMRSMAGTRDAAREAIEVHQAAGRRFAAGGVRELRSRAGRRRPGRAPARGPDQLVPVPEGDSGARRAGLAGRRLRLPGPRTGRAARELRLHRGPASRGGPARRSTRSEIERCHLVVHDIGGPIGCEWAVASPDRVLSLTALNTLLGLATFRRPWTMAPFAVPGLGRSRWLTLTPWAFSRHLLPPGSRGPHSGAPRRDLRPLRAAEARRRRSGIPADHAGLRARRRIGSAASGRGSPGVPTRRGSSGASAIPAIGLDQMRAGAGGARRRATRSCCPPSTSCRRTSRSRWHRRSPTSRRRSAEEPSAGGSGGAAARAPFSTRRGAAALGKRDLDDVEVARRLGRRELLARLGEHLADVVARGDVDQGEQPHARLPGQLGRLAGGGVAGLGGALGLLVGEARVVDEQLGLVRGDARSSRRARCRP